MGFWKRIRRLGPASRAQREHDLEREIRNHLDLEAEESGPHGARRAFGNVTLVKEDMRAAWGWPRMEELVHDVRISFRMLRRTPGFAVTAVLVLALGLGASTAMFSALDRILFRPLPYADPDRLVHLGWTLSAALTGPSRTQTVLASRGYRERWKPGPEPLTDVTTVFNATGVGSTCDVTEQPAERLVVPWWKATFWRRWVCGRSTGSRKGWPAWMS